MELKVTKSQFKPKALAYFRQVQETKKPLIITEHGRPVLKIVPYSEDAGEALNALRGSVLKYDRPTEPVGEDDWESMR